jgi:hypothetical protein
MKKMPTNEYPSWKTRPFQPKIIKIPARMPAWIQKNKVILFSRTRRIQVAGYVLLKSSYFV